MKNVAPKLTSPDLCRPLDAAPDVPLHPMHPHAVTGDDRGFGLIERYRASDIPGWCLEIVFFGIIPGFAATVMLAQFLPNMLGGFWRHAAGYAVLLLMTGPFLACAAWTLKKLLLRRSLLFTRGLLVRRLVFCGRVVREKVRDLSEFHHVKVRASCGAKTGWSYTVLCQGDRTEEKILSLRSRRDVVAFANWLGKRLSLPVDLPPLWHGNASATRRTA